MHGQRQAVNDHGRRCVISVYRGCTRHTGPVWRDTAALYFEDFENDQQAGLFAILALTGADIFIFPNFSTKWARSGSSAKKTQPTTTGKLFPLSVTSQRANSKSSWACSRWTCQGMFPVLWRRADVLHLDTLLAIIVRGGHSANLVRDSCVWRMQLSKPTSIRRRLDSGNRIFDVRDLRLMEITWDPTISPLFRCRDRSSGSNHRQELSFSRTILCGEFIFSSFCETSTWKRSWHRWRMPLLTIVLNVIWRPARKHALFVDYILLLPDLRLGQHQFYDT